MSLLRQGKALVLTIYLGESDQWQGKPLYVAIVQLLRAERCAGATVSRAIAGYGAGSRLHTQQSLHWSSDAPLVLQVIDQPERIRRILPRLQEMLNGGLITLHEVEVLKYTHARRRGLPTRLPVAQVMETAITTVQLTTSVAEVLPLLVHAPFRALPVVDTHNRLQGIISTGDLIRAGLLPVRRGVMRTALELDSQMAQTIATPLTQLQKSELCAGDIMNHQVRSISTETTLGEAAHIMVTTGLKRLPVVDADQRLRGMLSRTDLLQVIVTSPIMSQEASSATQPLSRSRPLTTLPVPQQPVTMYMQSEVATVEEQTPLAEVIDALILSPQKRVFVVDGQQRVQGVISDIDVLTRLQAEVRPGVLRLLTNWTRGKPGRMPTGALRTSSGKARVAADVMNRDLVTVPETASVQETIERMISTGRKVVPVIDPQGQMQGVVGRSDLLQLLIEEEG
jgi:CBS-domain-containing membrane protein